jgi:PGF-CTERM protein
MKLSPVDSTYGRIMVLNRSRGPVAAVAIAVVLASLLAPGVLAQGAQQSGQPESEPNDSPRNATLIQPGATVTGEITTSENATTADADWFALPVQDGQNVSVAFESGNESERLLVFLASPSASGNVSAVNDTLADATIAPSGSTVQLNATANGSRLYFIGVTGRSGGYQFTVETTGNGTMTANGTDVPMMNGTNMTNATMGNGTMMANDTDMPMANATTSTQATSTTNAPTTTEATTTAETTANTGGSGGDGGSGEETSTTGPGFGLLAALIAVLAAALLAKRRR